MMKVEKTEGILMSEEYLTAEKMYLEKHAYFHIRSCPTGEAQPVLG